MAQKIFGIAFIPPERPKKEWEHVQVTKGGRRYVDVEELLNNGVAMKEIEAIAALTAFDVQDAAK